MKRLKAAVGALKERRAERGKADLAWMKKRFDELERQHGMILKRLDDGGGDGEVIPELEEQIRIAAKAVLNIDWKVADREVPPAG